MCHKTRESKSHPFLEISFVDFDLVRDFHDILGFNGSDVNAVVRYAPVSEKKVAFSRLEEYCWFLFC